MSFQKDYDHWQSNRDRFKGIHPDHDNKRWEISVLDRGTRLKAHVGSLRVAKQAVNTFRQSAGEG